MGRPAILEAPCVQGCGARALWRGMCRNCYERARKAIPADQRAAAVSGARWRSVKDTYPSTRLDTDGWFRALRDDDALFNAILGDIAHYTRLQVDRGRLHLDSTGREITEREPSDA